MRQGVTLAVPGAPQMLRLFGPQLADTVLLSGYAYVAEVLASEQKILLLPQTGLTGWSVPPRPLGPAPAEARQLEVEGMLVELCRNHTSAVASLSGRAIAELTGVPKATFETRARSLFGRGLGEAGAAALAALYRAGR